MYLMYCSIPYNSLPATPQTDRTMRSKDQPSRNCSLIVMSRIINICMLYCVWFTFFYEKYIFG
mgnify:CR=1 FL=1